jgi:CheY-like chemotaxis protein
MAVSFSPACVAAVASLFPEAELATRRISRCEPLGIRGVLKVDARCLGGCRPRQSTNMAGDSSAILIVDDDEAIRESLGDFLADEGFAVKTADNGREALDILAAGFRPCAILLDLMMPVLNGWDFRAEQLRSPAVAGIPTAIVSGCGFSAQTMQAQFPGAEILNKPVVLPRLLEFVRRHCGEIAGPS